MLKFFDCHGNWPFCHCPNLITVHFNFLLADDITEEHHTAQPNTHSDPWTWWMLSSISLHEYESDCMHNLGLTSWKCTPLEAVPGQVGPEVGDTDIWSWQQWVFSNLYMAHSILFFYEEVAGHYWGCGGIHGSWAWSKRNPNITVVEGEFIKKTGQFCL